MTCREVIEFLMDYLSGDLPKAEHAAFAAHLEICEACVAYLHNYQEAVRVGRACLCAADSPLQPVPEELVQAILASREKREEGSGVNGES
jgi:anti-sigma factor RsiW